jgi:hypothetical protein
MQQEGFELPEDGVFQITLQKAVGNPQKIEYIGVFEPLSSKEGYRRRYKMASQ